MTNAIEIRGLRKSFSDLDVLNGIDLDVAEGEAVVLLGSSGSGKSTLLRCINFMEEPTAGQVRVNGDLIGTKQGEQMRYKEADLCKLRARIGMVFQHFNLFPHMTVLENVMEGQVIVLGRSKAEARDKSMTQLARVGLEEKAQEYPARISGGQKQRVAIARALAMDPEVMLFDEITSALDPELVGEVLKTMLQLAKDGMTMVCVTHEIGFAYNLANKVCFLHDGLILEQGSPQSVLQTPKTERVRDFLAGHALFKLPN